jgi:hypothetical protein
MDKIEISEGLAEFYGAMIGDGCLSKYFARYDQRWRFCLLLTGHTHDGHYYKEILRPIFIEEFGTKGYIQFRSKDNVVRFLTLSKRIFKFFEGMDFPVGKKENLRIPSQMFSSESTSLACVRGIFDTDGSVYRRYSKKYKKHARLYNYLVVQFKMNSVEVIRQIKSILERNNIKTNNIIRDGKSFVLRITEQKGIHKFMELIKPSNKHHIERYLKNSKFSRNTGL